jgi:hypothetical protein
MDSSLFLQVPNTVREQIYTELLTYPTVACANNDAQASAAPASPIGQILTLTRAIHPEVVSFLERQLCVLIKTNDHVLVETMLAQTEDSLPVPIVSQLRSKNAIVSKDASQAPIAMNLDLFKFENDLPTESYDAFLMPASSMQAVLDKMSHQGWAPWCMRASLSFTLLRTFSHTQERALENLVQPWLNSSVPPKFLGISTSHSIPENVTLQLRKWLQVISSFSQFFGRLTILIHHAKYTSGHLAWGRTSQRFAMATRYAKLLWHCHIDSHREFLSSMSIFDKLFSLWVRTAGLGVDHTMALWKTTGTPGVALSEEAAASSADSDRMLVCRQVAEEMISFLSQHSPYGHEQTVDDTRTTAVRRWKSTLSYRAHAPCKVLGDVDAALGYLEDALKYGAADQVTMMTNEIGNLKATGAKATGLRYDGVVRWGLQEGNSGIDPRRLVAGGPNHDC